MSLILKNSNRRGMTLIEIIMVLLIMGILCAIAVPNFTRMRTNAYRDKCITNLRTIAAAKEHWSLETGAADTATPTTAQLNTGYGYIKGGTSSLVCPLDPSQTFATSYNINNMSTNPACKIDSTHTLEHILQ